MKTKNLILTSLAALVLCVPALSQTLPSYLPTQGLIGWWPFSGDASDQSGNHYDGTVGGAALTTDRFGHSDHAFVFDGLDDKIVIPPFNSGTITQEMSISLWVNNQTNTDHQSIFLRQGDNFSKTWILKLNGSNGFRVYNENGNYTEVYPTNFAENQWFHVLVTFKNSNVKIFLNGDLIQNSELGYPLTYTDNSQLLGYSGGTGNQPYPYKGKIDDVAIWNRALSPEEIHDVFIGEEVISACNPLKGSILSGLVAYYPFCGNANDESGNDLNGTVYGAKLTNDRFGHAGSAYYFDGLADHIEVASHHALDLRTKFSISAWYQMDTLYTNPPYGGSIVARERFPESGGYYLSMSDRVAGGVNNDPPDGSCPTCNLNVLSPELAQSHVWTHVVEVWDGDSLFLFVNGVLKASANGHLPGDSLLLSNMPLLIGQGYLNNKPIHSNFKGDIDDIGIWNRVLTANEVSELHSNGICYQYVTVTDTLVINANITGFNPIAYQNTIKIYPNPARDHITIDNGDITTLAGYKLKIMNSAGQQVFQSSINQQQFYIDLRTWTGTGLYFVHVIDGAGNTIDIKKIVLQ